METKIYRRIKLQQKKGEKSRETEKLPKIDTQVTLGDASTTILKIILTTTLTTIRDDQWRQQLIYAHDVPNICLRHAPDMSKICLRYTQDMPKIRPKYAQDMPQIISNLKNINH